MADGGSGGGGGGGDGGGGAAAAVAAVERGPSGSRDVAYVAGGLETEQFVRVWAPRKPLDPK